MEGGMVNWQAPGLGSAHQLWRMNLHYMEYLEGATDELWAKLAADWIASNPKTRSGAWEDAWNSYALSVRVAVWLQELARRKERLSSDTVNAVEASAANQLRFLERNLETDLGGNHLIKNIKALIWASAYFAGEDSERWRRAALRLLSKELKKQVLPDGMHSERSASYHAQAFADLLECRHALGEDPFGGRLDETLGRMAQALANVTHPDGTPMLFNDAGLGMAYSPAECLSAYERLLGERPQAQQVFALEAAGYYGIHAGDTCFIADCGRVAPDGLPAHGHGDVLSFELSAGGQRVIVDQGVFEYAAGEKRQRARSAWNHNTLCFEGADQADFYGAFRCGRRPDVSVLKYQPRPDGFVLEGTHNGFDALPGKPRHIRRFHVRPEAIVIHDRIEGAADRPARIGFLLHPKAEILACGQGAALRCGSAILKLTASLPFGIEPAVWWSDMGVELATSRIVLQLPPHTEAVRTEIRISSCVDGALEE